MSQTADRPTGLDRLQAEDVDAAIEQIWTEPETLARVRDYVARHVAQVSARQGPRLILRPQPILARDRR